MSRILTQRRKGTVTYVRMETSRSLLFCGKDSAGSGAFPVFEKTPVSYGWGSRVDVRMNMFHYGAALCEPHCKITKNFSYTKIASRFTRAIPLDFFKKTLIIPLDFSDNLWIIPLDFSDNTWIIPLDFSEKEA